SHGAFNLCPSEVCNPGDGSASHCEVPQATPSKPVEFFPYADVPAAAVESGRKLMEAGHLDVGGIEYLEARDGRLVFYDINANSNLRAPIARHSGSTRSNAWWTFFCHTSAVWSTVSLRPPAVAHGLLLC